MFARWQLYLSEFDFKIEHRAGVCHTNADMLSRHDDVFDETSELSADGLIVFLSTPQIHLPLIKEISKRVGGSIHMM